MISLEKKTLTMLQESVLEDLLQDLLVTDKEDTYEIDYHQALSLSNADRKVLGIPLSIPYSIYIYAKGTLNENDYEFCWHFLESDSSIPIFFQRIGAYFHINNNHYLPSSFQNDIIKLLDAHSILKEKSFAINLECLGKLKSNPLCKATDCGLIFDSYLTFEHVVVVDQFRLDFKENSDGSINVLPSIDHKADEGLKKAFDMFPKAKNLYNTQHGDDKVRVLIPSDKQESLDKLKRDFKKISGAKKEDILKNPQAFFDESEFELDFYSKRVYELGYYQPKFYPFIKPFSTDWVNGITIEKASGDRLELLVENEQEFNDLLKELDHAKTSNLPTVSFKGEKIPFEHATSIVDSYEAIKEKKDLRKGFRDRQGKKVLIIHENIEDVDYQDEAPQAIEHFFETPKRLRKEIQILDHQKEGIAWLQSLSKSGSGALLADDMGLGKTLQVLSFLDWSIDYQNNIGSDFPNLIVAPVTLLENWENEQKKFFEPYATMVRYYGKDLKYIDLETLSKKDIILTTYETLRTKQLQLCKVYWFSAILDEAQRIKTPGTMVTNASKALNAEFKVAMTGTPVENSWMDLWCLSDFISSGILGSAKDFNDKYNLSLKEQEVDLKALGDDIRKQLGLYIKRRIKSQILTSLPDKQAYHLPKNMPDIQAEQYLNELDYYQKNKSKENQMLVTLHKLRLISDHPLLVKDENEVDELDVDYIINSSAKLQETVAILERIKKLNEKVILFSHFERVQKILQKVVLEYFGIPVNIINGKTSTVGTSEKFSRQKLIDKFQQKEGFNVIIMSPIAAGYGLNVTGANHVIHYTRHWNPAKENQATDRVYRIGQEKPVSIYYPMAVLGIKETFDQKLDKLLTMKNKLSEASLYPSEACEVKIRELQDLLD